LPSTPSSVRSERPRRWVVPLAAVLVVALIAAITAFAVSSGTDNEAAGNGRCPSQLPTDVAPVTVGEQVPDFSLPGLNGGCVHLSDFHGQPLVVNFWASWCHPCRVEFPLLADARDRYADRGVEVIGIDFRDIASDARAFAEEKRATWPLVIDEHNIVAKAFRVPPIPQTFFVARDGTLVSHVYGLTSARDLNAQIKRALKH
jgi:cytochrome c biogenesis protein CcmG/thiol:disulfide interchange protein DsbE